MWYLVISHKSSRGEDLGGLTADTNDTTPARRRRRRKGQGQNTKDIGRIPYAAPSPLNPFKGSPTAPK